MTVSNTNSAYSTFPVILTTENVNSPSDHAQLGIQGNEKDRHVQNNPNIRTINKKM